MANWVQKKRSGIAYKSIGSTAKNHLGQVVVLPGGPGLSSDYFLPCLSDLSQDLRFELLLIDLPGHGHSRGFGDLDYSGLVLALARFLTTLPSRPTYLIGHSFGAMVAIDLVRQKLFLPDQMILISAALDFSTSAIFKKKMSKLISPEPSIESESEFLKYWCKIMPLYFFRQRAKRAWTKLFEKTHWATSQKIQSTIQKINLEKRDIVVPTLFIEGRHDIRFKKSRRLTTFRRLVGFAGISYIEKSGHFPMLENPREINKAIAKFLVEGDAVR